MRAAMMLSFLVLAQFGRGAPASGQTPPPLAEHPLILNPTAIQTLAELRVNTGKEAIARDGTMNAVYIKKVPSEGNVYLNFHVEVTSVAGPVVLRSKGIYLQGAVVRTAAQSTEGTREKIPPETPLDVSYTPMDQFIDTGAAEVRGDSLTVNVKAIVQFTIEVPRAGLDDLTLFVRSQRVGTVREIREQIGGNRGNDPR